MSQALFDRVAAFAPAAFDAARGTWLSPPAQAGLGT
jgi:hypothetical protein